MRIDTQLYLVWCDALDIDESEAHQVEATSPAEAIELVAQSLWDCGEWPDGTHDAILEVGVCNATGDRNERWFFLHLQPHFEIVCIEDTAL